MPAGLCFACDFQVSMLMSPLSFDNGWTDRNEDCCVNAVDENCTKITNLVNIGPVTPANRS